jgi:hypothetical protein
MEEDYYQMLSQALNAGYNPYMPQYGQTQQAELYELPQQQQQQGMDMQSAMNIYDMFSSGGGAGAGGAGYGGVDYGVASSPASGGGTWYGPLAEGGAASGGTTGGTSAAGGAGGSSWMAAAGPWAALAAIIAGNEREARRGGYRDEDDWEYSKDLLGGKVFEQDIEKRWSPYLDEMDSKLGTNTGDTARMIGNLSTFDFSNAGKDFEKSLKKDPLVKGILSLF